MKKTLCYALTLFLLLHGGAQAIPRGGMSSNSNKPSLSVNEKLYALKISIDPSKDILSIACNENIEYASVCDMAGHEMIAAEGRINLLDIHALAAGMYLLKLKSFDGNEMAVHFIRN